MVRFRLTDVLRSTRRAGVAFALPAALAAAGLGGPSGVTATAAAPFGAPPAVDVAGPMPIVQNVGQWPAWVDFAVGAFGQGPWLDGDGLILLRPGSADSDGRIALAGDLGVTHGSAVRISVAGGWSAERPLASPAISYFVGADPARHRASVPVWAEARRALVDGAELVVTAGGPRGWRWRIESGSPGGRDFGPPSAIRLVVHGADAIRSGVGGIEVDTRSGPLRLPPLEGTTHGAAVTIERAEGGRVSVVSSIGSADSVAPISSVTSPSRAAAGKTAGPGLEWGTYFGGGWDEKLFALDVGADGSVYATGSSTSPDLPVTPGALETRLRGDRSAYVAKLSPDGARMEALTFLGGSGTDYAKAIALDRETGDIVVGGDTLSRDFPTTPDAYLPASSAPLRWNAFLVRLSPDGTALRHATYFGGASDDYVEDLAVGQGGAITLLLETWSSDLETPERAALRSHRGGGDAFVVRFDPITMRPVIASYIGGSGADCHDCSLAVGLDDTIYVAGWTNSDDLPITRGAFSETRRGMDGYVVALDRSGEAFRYGTYIGGSGADCTIDCEIVVDSAGTTYLIGSTASADFPTTPGAFSRTFSGGGDMFVAVLASDGTSLAFSTYFGGRGNDRGHRIVPRGDGIWVLGATNSPDLPTTPDAFMPSRAGVDDLFLAVFARDGSGLRYATYLGGSAEECEFNCGMVVSGGAFIVGATTYSRDMPVTAGAFAERSAGRAEGYIARVAPGAAAPLTPTATPTPEVETPTLTATATPEVETPTATATPTLEVDPTATATPTLEVDPPTPDLAPSPVHLCYLPFAASGDGRVAPPLASTDRRPSVH